VANLHAKFEVSSFKRYGDMKGSKNFKVGHVTLSRPHRPNFALFSLGPPAANLCAKFKVSSYNRSEDMEESQNFKSRSRDPFTTALVLLLHFFVRTPSGQSACQI